MRKKSVKPKNSKDSTRHAHKSLKHYLKIYFISLFVAAIIFMGGIYFFKPQSPCANSATCKSDLSMSVDNNTAGMFEGHIINPPKIDLEHDAVAPAVLGANIPAQPKHIYVDLSTQTLYAFEGTTQIMQTLISSGKWGPTPIGNFHVWEKLRSTRMAGGEGADAYDLPNVPYVMYFYQDFGLHGAYWHDNFGNQMSHGCVNMRTVDAEELYNWADGPTATKQGTAVSICNQFMAPNTCVQQNPIND